ncbi:hypothetical protein [Deinococcus maricopensis]|uniref:Uncharacterized protein n=1 Tax=Deinococcus maricopensis (strain DSM 21211 / LMG 22137 / NRRL B-23946 / LB-34) TaxID=709986 RepID=E8U607_DEIML|nr:hypothetical protein [Deinococcus maricopensis]ADV66496.1 hypothetical protein Deima_0841 [Deinococcus maricopensis DSM 21211]
MKSDEKKLSRTQRPRPGEVAQLERNGTVYTLPTIPLEDDEVSRSHRVRLHIDYIDVWDELSPRQRFGLIKEAINARREKMVREDLEQRILHDRGS